jgi:hypothetical protein
MPTAQKLSMAGTSFHVLAPQSECWTPFRCFRGQSHRLRNSFELSQSTPSAICSGRMAKTKKPKIRTCYSIGEWYGAGFESLSAVERFRRAKVECEANTILGVAWRGRRCSSGPGCRELSSSSVVVDVSPRHSSRVCADSRRRLLRLPLFGVLTVDDS